MSKKYIKGDVVVLPFPYTDLSNIKKRPALVVANLRGQNVILAQITTKKREDEDLIKLNKNNFSSGFLKIDSFIMASLLFTSDVSRISYKAGTLKKQKIKEIEKKFCKIFTR